MSKGFTLLDAVDFLADDDAIDYVEIIAIKKISDHEDDSHAYIVVLERDENHADKFVVYSCNVENESLSSGFYTDDIEEAIENFNERGFI